MRKMISEKIARNQTNLARLRIVLASPLVGFARTQTDPLTVWTVAYEARVRRSRLMTAVIAMQNVAYCLQQFEPVPLYTKGTALIIRRDRFPQMSERKVGTRRQQDAAIAAKSTPNVEECKQRIALHIHSFYAILQSSRDLSEVGMWAGRYRLRFDLSQSSDHSRATMNKKARDPEHKSHLIIPKQ
jgi:hypothetical protein